MKLSSTSYFNMDFIPLKYCGQEMAAAQNISPLYSWSDFPNSTKSFLLIMKDLHPKAKNPINWILTDIPINITKIPEGASNSSKMPPGVKELKNDYGRIGYIGPQPKKGTGEHNYETIVYALDIESTGLSGQLNEKKILNKINANIIATANMTGRFKNS